MKKILFICALFVALFVNAQDTDSEIVKLSELIKTAKEKSNTSEKAKAVVDIMIFSAKTKNLVLRKSADSAVAVLNNYALIDKIAEEKDVVLSKSINDLSKDDLKGFKVENDKFRSITFITPKNSSNKEPYISIKGGILNMRLKMEYYGDSWIFWDKTIIIYDGNKFEYNVGEPDREVSSSAKVTETSDIKMSTEMINKFRDIVNSKIVEVRYSGSKGNKDFEMTDRIKDAIKNTIILYDKLKK